jgi:hypothetical protein
VPLFRERTVVAAATRPVTAAAVGDPGALGKSLQGPMTIGLADSRQAQAWDIYDRVGPVASAHRYSANVMRRVKFYAAYLDPEGAGDPIPGDKAIEEQPDGTGPLVDEAQWREVKAAVDRIRDPREGQGGITYALTLNLLVAADCYITKEDLADGSEDWQVRSVIAIERRKLGSTGSGWWVPNENGSGKRELPVGTFIARVHLPHPKDARYADCAMLHVLTDCEEYDYLSRGVIASARSFIAGNGIFLVPNELDIPPDPDSPEEVAAKRGSASTLLRILGRAAAAAIKDPRSPSATSPTIVSGKGEHLQYARHITFARPLDEQHAKERGEKLKVIAIGLDLPQERLSPEGMANNNHWSAAQVTENEWNAYLDPLARIEAANWTVQMLWPQLDELGFTPEQRERWCVWYDPADAIERPDKSVNAQQAHDRMAISDAALRNYSGFDEDDAPNPEEIAARVERERLKHTRSQNGPEEIPPGDVSPDGKGGSPAPAPTDEPTGTPPVDKTAPKQQNAVRASAAGLARLAWLARHDPPRLRELEAAGARRALLAAGRQKGRALGEQLADLDERLLHRVIVAADAAMRRELERAGARIQQAATRRGLAADGRRRAGEAELRTIPKHRIAAHLGRSVVAAALADQDVFDDSTFDDFCDQVDGWTDDTRDRSKQLIVAAALAAALGRGQDSSGITPAVLTEWQQQQAQDSSTGRAALKQAMIELAGARLYDPDPRVDDRGEYDPDLSVPAGMIRSALAAYGGATLTGDGAAGRTPYGASLVAAGATMLQLARTGGLQLVAYEWRHGSPLHPFEPHENLDGQTFDNFDDPTLRIDDASSWIESLTGGFFPGDHDGCTCMVAVIFGTGDDI